MLNFLIKRPIAVVLSFTGAVILGVLVLRQLPISLLPEVPIPSITVQVLAGDKEARELENTVTLPLRNQLMQVNGLKDIHSETRHGQALITLSFDHGQNTDLTFIEVNEKIDQQMTFLPREVERPRVLKTNAADIPVMHLAITQGPADATSRLQLSEFCRSVLKRRLEQLSTIAFVDMTGFETPVITLQPYWSVLNGLGWDEAHFTRILRQNDLDLNNILVKDGQYQYQIRFTSRLTSLEDLADIYVQAGGRLLQLKDLAHLDLASENPRGLSMQGAQPGIIFSIRKKANAQLFTLQDELTSTLQQFRTEYPQLNYTIFDDQTAILRLSIDNLTSHLLVGGLLAIFIMFLFFNEWRDPLMIAIAVPVSLIISLFGFYLLDLSINVVSLSGLILGVGLMIDNTIIVIDNIRHYRHRGHPAVEAGVQGTNEVILPLFSSSLTNVAVFVPLIFMSGLAGALFFDQAMSIVIALGASMVVAYLLIPTVLRLIGKKTWTAKKNTGGPDNWFTRSVDVVLRHKIIFSLLFLGYLALAAWQERGLIKEAFPALSHQGVEVQVDWNEPLTLSENQARYLQLYPLLVQQQVQTFAYVGEKQFLLSRHNQDINELQLVLMTDSARISQRALAEIILSWIKEHYPQATCQVTPLRNMFDYLFAGAEPPLVADIYTLTGRDAPDAAEAKKVVAALNQAGYAVSVPASQEQILIKLKWDQLALYNLAPEIVLDKLRSLFNQYEIGQLRTSQQFIPIRIRHDHPDLYHALSKTLILNSQAEPMPLNYFVEFAPTSAYKSIYADKGGEILPLPISAAEWTDQARIRTIISKEQTLGVRFRGQLFTDRQTVRELVVILGVSLLLLFLILAAQFESVILPLFVMSSVPFGLAGAVMGLWIMEDSINLLSLIGMVVMSGIVVNDSILKVDMTIRAIKDGHALTEAIHIAGTRRIRPILMTTLVEVLAVMPVLFSSGLGAELQRPLAITLTGGLLLGTVTSLYLVPLLFKWFWRKIK